MQYRMEHIDQPGVPIDLANTCLSHFKKYEFYFFRESSEYVLNIHVISQERNHLTLVVYSI